MANKNQHCSFCGKPKEETRRLITGPDGACICDECVDICKSMVEEWENENLSDAELAYYIDVQAKITKKLLEIAYKFACFAV